MRIPNPGEQCIANFVAQQKRHTPLQATGTVIYADADVVKVARMGSVFRLTLREFWKAYRK